MFVFSCIRLWRQRLLQSSRFDGCDLHVFYSRLKPFILMCSSYFLWFSLASVPLELLHAAEKSESVPGCCVDEMQIEWRNVEIHSILCLHKRMHWKMWATRGRFYDDAHRIWTFCCKEGCSTAASIVTHWKSSRSRHGWVTTSTKMLKLRWWQLYVDATSQHVYYLWIMLLSLYHFEDPRRSRWCQ